MKISLLGNCQIEPYYRLLEYWIPGCKVTLHPIHLLESNEYKKAYQTLKKSDLVLSHPLSKKYDLLSSSHLKGRLKSFTLIHNLYFRGQLPDSNYLLDRLQSPLGDYNSEIVYECYKNGISPEACYREFHKLNSKKRSREAWQTSYFELLNREMHVDVPFAAELIYLSKHERTFHTINHPTIKLIAHYLSKILNYLNIESKGEVESEIEDPLLRDAILPIFEEVIDYQKLEFDPSNTYKKPNSLGGQVLNLEEFIFESYSLYKKQIK